MTCLSSRLFFGAALVAALSLFTNSVRAQDTGEPENLGPNINSAHSELRPIISPDGSTLFFIREGDSLNMGTGDDQDVWYSELQADGTWGEAHNMGAPINNATHNAVNAITPDGNTLLLSNQYFKDGTTGPGASLSHRTMAGWSFPEPLDIKDLQNQSPYVDYFLTNDGKQLLLAIQDSESIGERDIYVSFLQKDGSWSHPMNLGPDINTEAKDASPFLASDGVTLYFASEGHGGYGGRDIFVSRRLDNTWKHWSKPENLGDKINGPDFDAYYSVSAKGDYAYFVTHNEGTEEDIYRVKLGEAARPKPVVLVSGHVYDQKTKKPIASTIRYEVLPDGDDAGNAHSNSSDGAYKVTLPAGKNYGIRGEAKGYYAVNENLDMTAITEYKEITKDLYLAPIEVNQTIRLNNIFFETAKSDLKPESFSELDRVVNFLNENAAVSIAIKGHTDNVGGDQYNLNLSEARAKAVLTYLSQKGVNPDRLTSKGYGKNMPIASNDTEDGRAQNRRVEFTIVKN